MVTFAIAEDEAIERESLVVFIRRNLPEAEILWTAEDGLQALQQTADKAPDVLIVDINMPGLDGLSLCEQLIERGFTGSLLINTAYDKFDFARRALKFGAMDFLIKPASNDELLAALKRAAQRAEERRASPLALNDARLRRYSEAYVFEHLLSGVDVQELLEAFGWPHERLQTCAFLLHLRQGQRQETRLRGLLSVRYARSLTTVLWRVDGQRLLMLAQPRHSLSDQRCRTAFHLLGQALMNACSDIPHIALSELCHSVPDLCAACKQLLDVPMPGAERLSVPWTRALRTQETTVRLVNALRRHIAEGEKRYVAKALRTIWNRSSADDPELLWRLTSICILAGEGSGQLRLADTLLEGLVLDGKPADEARFNAFLDVLDAALQPRIRPEAGGTLAEIRCIMETEYAQDLSQTELAQRVGMNPSYFSRYFKAQTGRRFIDMITEIRIGHALEMLLENPRCTMEQLAKGCGFYSKTHFGEVFKKCMGKTVGQYQQERLQQSDREGTP